MSVRHGSPVWPAVVLAALTTLPLSAQRPARADETLVIRDATVIDGTGAGQADGIDISSGSGLVQVIANNAKIDGSSALNAGNTGAGIRAVTGGSGNATVILGNTTIGDFSNTHLD